MLPTFFDSAKEETEELRMSSATLDEKNARQSSSYEWVEATKDDGLRGERFEKKIQLKSSEEMERVEENIHSMSFRSPTNGVMNILVHRKYPDKRQIYPSVLISSSCQVRTTFRQQHKCTGNIPTQSVIIFKTTVLNNRETFFVK